MAQRFRFGAALLLPALAAPARADNWPAWRGPTGQGLCSEKGLPLRFGPGEKVRWKTALPHEGSSTPIVWGRRVFVTQATGHGTRRMLLCFDRSDGRLLWQRVVEYPQAEPTHGDNP